MRPQQTLESRTAAALGGNKVCADDLEVLIPDIEAGIAAADETARRERERTLDPVVSSQDATLARDRAEVAELQRDRLETALPRVRQRLASALQAEYADRWSADAGKIVARARAADEQVARYAEWAELIAVALAGAEAVNKEIERLNSSAPDGELQRIGKIDLAHLKNLILPDPSNPARNLWPPHQPSIAEQYAASMGASAHPGADWAEYQRQRATAARAGQERLARYHEEAGRQEEARQNADERERFAQRRG